MVPRGHVDVARGEILTQALPLPPKSGLEKCSEWQPPNWNGKLGVGQMDRSWYSKSWQIRLFLRSFIHTFINHVFFSLKRSPWCCNKAAFSLFSVERSRRFRFLSHVVVAFHWRTKAEFVWRRSECSSIECLRRNNDE